VEWRGSKLPQDHGTKQILLLAYGGAKRSTNVPHVKRIIIGKAVTL
jgi:hypothetical protein